MPSRNPSRLCRVHYSVINHPCRRSFGAPGLPSRSAYPLRYLSLLRCCLLDGYHLTRTLCRVQIKTTRTPPKPLQTLAFLGVSQPHDGDAKTTARRPCTTDAQGGHGTAVITAYKGTCPRDTTRHAKTQSDKHANVAHTTTPPRGEPPPGLSAGAGGTIAEIVRGFLKSSRTKRDACKPSSRSAHGLQAVQDHVVQPLLHLFC